MLIERDLQGRWRWNQKRRVAEFCGVACLLKFMVIKFDMMSQQTWVQGPKTIDNPHGKWTRSHPWSEKGAEAKRGAVHSRSVCFIIKSSRRVRRFG
jgi:hypothetical protein